MKRTKMWWSHLTKDEKTELVLTERAFPYGFARGERYRELVDKADRAEATRQNLNCAKDGLAAVNAAMVGGKQLSDDN